MSIKKYLQKIKDVLVYFDFEPLLFMWVASDILNNMVLWTTLDYWESVDQPNTYWLYLTYLISSVGMMVFLHNKKWLARFISFYLTVYLFSEFLIRNKREKQKEDYSEQTIYRDDLILRVEKLENDKDNCIDSLMDMKVSVASLTVKVEFLEKENERLKIRLSN